MKNKFSREVLPDGTKGQVRISTQELGVYNRYLLKDGQIVTDPAYLRGKEEGKVLLGKRGHEPYKGSYDIIGGFMEADELPGGSRGFNP